MLYHEFKEWLEENASGYPIFIEKATEYQQLKNKPRSGKNKWNEKKMDRAIRDMWNKTVTAAYDQIKAQKGVPKYDGKNIWLSFMEENNFLELFNEGASEAEFE